jgi:thiamine biosynthesis lipoprotein
VVITTFEHIDSLFNKWNSHSELYRLNHWNSTEPFICSPELFAMLKQCEQFFNICQGRFDPTVEPLERLWISALEKGEVPSQEQIDEIRPALGWEKIRLQHIPKQVEESVFALAESPIFDSEKTAPISKVELVFSKSNLGLSALTNSRFSNLSGYNSIVKPDPRTGFDLGGIAKGHGVDLLVERLAQIGFTSVYVEWGGEIRTKGLHPDGRPWKIGIRHPHNANSVLQIIETKDAALATSGDYFQYWTITVNGEKKLFFHVFDLKAGRPLQATGSSLASVTIQQESCLAADAIAKTFLFASTKEEAIKIFTQCILPSFPTAKAWMFSHDEADI